MMTIEQLRDKIDRIDHEIGRLFGERMDIASEVAKTKLPDASKILNRKREEEVVETRTAPYPEKTKNYAKMLFMSLMRYSREYQYRIMTEEKVYPGYHRNLERPLDSSSDQLTICYQGIEGSWSSKAAQSMYQKAKLIHAEYFEDVFEMVEKGEADAGILPFENSTSGIITEVYDNLAKYHLYINGSFDQLVIHCLAVIPGTSAEDIKTVLSHPQALSQCSEYIRSMGYAELPSLNTAVAAHDVMQGKDRTVAAICSREAAQQYGLAVILDDIGNIKGNSTRFISITKKLYNDRNSNRINIVFRLPHISGSLSNLVSLFSDNGLNINCIHSRPLPDRSWEYRFYLDFSGNLEEKTTQALLLQLENELPSLKILGSYHVNDRSE